MGGALGNREVVPVALNGNAKAFKETVQDASARDEEEPNRKGNRKYFVTIKFEDRVDNECVICDSFLGMISTNLC
jgi:hypothetical protein